MFEYDKAEEFVQLAQTEADSSLAEPRRTNRIRKGTDGGIRPPVVVSGQGVLSAIFSIAAPRSGNDHRTCSRHSPFLIGIALAAPRSPPCWCATTRPGYDCVSGLAMEEIIAGAMSPKSVLLVEDDDELRGLVADTLRDAGFSVRSLPLAAQTFDELRVSTPDVIVLDLKMPHGSLQGTEVLVQLRDDEVGRDIPVIILSGLGDLVNRDVARRLGVKAILAKPLSLKDLITTIRLIDVSP